jgi:hypothetical protein
MPDPEKPFTIESDASKFASGAVLRQQDINRDWHPCRYISHSFNQTERNYEIYDRELFGIIRALKAWRHYLQGSRHPVTILSDHKNLTYFRMAQKVKSPTSEMESTPLVIRHETSTCTWITNGAIRCIISES